MTYWSGTSTTISLSLILNSVFEDEKVIRGRHLLRFHFLIGWSQKKKIAAIFLFFGKYLFSLFEPGIFRSLVFRINQKFFDLPENVARNDEGGARPLSRASKLPSGITEANFFFF